MIKTHSFSPQCLWFETAEAAAAAAAAAADVVDPMPEVDTWLVAEVEEENVAAGGWVAAQSAAW